MRYGPVAEKDKSGRTVILRNAEVSDGEALIRYLRKTTEETPFLLRDPEEVSFTPEQEAAFIQRCLDDDRGLMLVATVDEELAGSCSMMCAGPFRRSRHRCEVAIALYRKFCGAGIGEMMMRAVLEAAGNAGYEQAELEVMAENDRAMALYRKLGFEPFGRFPHNMKYQDGSYADAIWMMKQL